MTSLRWTKQQDFCLRLGLLKALVAILPSQRLSAANATILRTLNRLYFDILVHHPSLEKKAGQVLRPLDEDTTVLDALLITSKAQSWGQPIDRKKAIKILEWARVVGLVGSRGNQITERGILLKTILPEGVARFVSGDTEAWNPFTFCPIERAFFFYHLGEQDVILWRLAREVGRLGAGVTLDPGAARQMTYHAMESLLDTVGSHVPMSDLSRLRTLRDLTSAIALELNSDYGSGTHRPYPVVRRKLRKAGPVSTRHTLKNSDHQAIPRFEILVDLGFLTKQVPLQSTGTELQRQRKAWRFTVTSAAQNFADQSAGTELEPAWQWNRFAHAVAAAGIAGASFSRPARPVDAFQVFADVYDDLHRTAGHTPFDSLALMTMLRLLERGLVMEIRQLHDAMLRIKRDGALGHLVFFASGNEPDRMFLLLKPEFRSAVIAWLAQNDFTTSWPHLEDPIN